MRLVLICSLALPVFGQLRGPDPAARPATHVRSNYRAGFWGAGGGYWNAPQTLHALDAPGPAEAKAPILAPILASSSLYQADHAHPVMREYGALLPIVDPIMDEVALVAFRDGRIEPVRAYWLTGEQFAYVTKQDTVRKVAFSSVDTVRSERLNRQQGVEFRIGKGR